VGEAVLYRDVFTFSTWVERNCLVEHFDPAQGVHSAVTFPAKQESRHTLLLLHYSRHRSSKAHAPSVE